MPPTPAQARQILDLARQAIRAALSHQSAAPPAASTEPLPEAAGCFVSLHDRHTHVLRGCVGQMHNAGAIEQMIQQTAVHTLADPRFAGTKAVRFDELANLEIELSLLTPMQPAATPMDFDPLADGVHLSIEGRSGVFLPQVARDTGWGREQLLDRLCTEKMRLPAGSWRVAAARLQTFKTIVVGPEAFDAPE